MTSTRTANPAGLPWVSRTRSGDFLHQSEDRAARTFCGAKVTSAIDPRKVSHGTPLCDKCFPTSDRLFRLITRWDEAGQ